MTLLQYLPFLGITVLANFGQHNRAIRWTTYGLLLFWNAMVALLGLYIGLLGTFRSQLSPQMIDSLGDTNLPGLAAICFLTAALGCLPLLPSVRRALARLLPIDPASTVHATALVFAVYLVGSSVAQMTLIGGLARLSAAEAWLTWPDVVGLGTGFGLLALTGVGAAIRRNCRQTMARLGLHRLTGRQMWVVAGLIVTLLAFDYAISWVWRLTLPANYNLITTVTDRLFEHLYTPLGALLIALSAGIGEELLFRGALQPRFGLVLTAALFAVAHAQYAFSPAVVEVFIVGLALGILRRRANTTACILVHAGYNFLDLLLLPFFP